MDQGIKSFWLQTSLDEARNDAKRIIMPRPFSGRPKCVSQVNYGRRAPGSRTQLNFIWTGSRGGGRNHCVALDGHWQNEPVIVISMLPDDVDATWCRSQPMGRIAISFSKLTCGIGGELV